MECKIGYDICNFRQAGADMKDNFTPLRFEKVIQVEKIITIFYMELSKDFCNTGERHDFWEMVYIDKGEMLCTADKHRFVLKSGEVTFHKPGEFHSLSGDGRTAPNVSILTFACDSPAMKKFEGKIFRLSVEEKRILSMLMTEGHSCFRLEDPSDPLLQTLQPLPDAPFGGSQMIRNLLEIFLIMLSRKKDVLTKSMRRNYVIDGVNVPYNVKEILDYLHANVYGKVTVRDIAQIIGKSESTVKQLFSQYRKNGHKHSFNIC